MERFKNRISKIIKWKKVQIKQIPANRGKEKAGRPVPSQRSLVLACWISIMRLPD
jgi:hypothetical protein